MEPTSPISRLVAFFVAPVCAAATAWLVNFAQTVANINLPSEQLGPLLVAAVLGELVVAFKWLDGRAKYEQAAAIEQASAE
jgi:hypothetical protein